MEKFGDATTADIGSTRNSLGSRMTELIEKRLGWQNQDFGSIVL
jgi:hypothetical protein